MKNCILFSLFVICFIGCGPKYKNFKEYKGSRTYQNPILVFLQDDEVTLKFSQGFAENISERLLKNNQAVSTYVATTFGKIPSSEVLSDINAQIARDGNDLLLLFSPTAKEVLESGKLQSITYKITGKDLFNQQEVYEGRYKPRDALFDLYDVNLSYDFYQHLRNQGLLR